MKVVDPRVNLIRELGLSPELNNIVISMYILIGWKLKLCATTTSIALVFYHKTKHLFPTENTDHYVSIYSTIPCSSLHYETIAACHG